MARGVLALRALVTVGAVLAVLGAVTSYVLDVAPLGPGFGPAALAVVAIGAATRRLGISLPGQGFASYIVGVSLFLRLLQAIFRPRKVRFACPACALLLHDLDAVHCKHCGRVLHIPDEGL